MILGTTKMERITEVQILAVIAFFFLFSVAAYTGERNRIVNVRKFIAINIAGWVVIFVTVMAMILSE